MRIVAVRLQQANHLELHCILGLHHYAHVGPSQLEVQDTVVFIDALMLSSLGRTAALALRPALLVRHATA